MSAKEERKLTIHTHVSLLFVSEYNVTAASCLPPLARYSLSHLLAFSSTMALSHRLGQSNPLLCSHQDFATTVRILKPSSGHAGHTGVKFEPMEDSPYLPLCTPGGAAAAASS